MKVTISVPRPSGDLSKYIDVNDAAFSSAVAAGVMHLADYLKNLLSITAFVVVLPALVFKAWLSHTVST